MSAVRAAPQICLIAGETSADLYGAALLPALRARLNDATFWGIGGSAMALHGFQSLLPMEQFQVMGFSDVIRRLPSLLWSLAQLKRTILQKQPDVVVCIDQPAFSIRLARALRQKGFQGKIVQWVAPSVWAYHPHRADAMAKYFDLLLTLFAFELPYFAHTPLKTFFVGHPIVEHIDKDQKPLSIAPGKEVLALFPGSRPAEIKRNLELQLKAAVAFTTRHRTYCIAIAGPHAAAVEKEVARLGHTEPIVFVPFSERYALMKRAHLAIAKSGTVTLELALHGVPTVVTYGLSRLNTFVTKYVLRLKLHCFSIANVLAGKELFFERIRPPVSPADITACLEAYSDPVAYAACQQECRRLHALVTCGESTAGRVAAHITSLCG